MSGGSYDYAYGRVQDMADALRFRSPFDAKRMAFAAHLDKVAKAMRDIEWNDSGDGATDEPGSIAACITPTDEVHAATAVAEKALASLQHAMESARRSGEGA